LEQNSEAAEQFHAVEQVSDHWLRRFHGDESDLEQFEEPVLPGGVDGDGTVGFGNSLTLSANFAKDVELVANGDIDGAVSFGDFLAVAANFGECVEVGNSLLNTVAGKTAFHPVLVGPILLNVIDDTYWADPV